MRTRKGTSQIPRADMPATGREDQPGEATLTRVTQRLGRVLVVDDDEVIRRLIAVNLQLEGFDVSTAVDGQDCLDKVAGMSARGIWLVPFRVRIAPIAQGREQRPPEP